MNDSLKTLNRFRKVLEDPNRVAMDWKEQGEKVVGYRCLYVPEEIIWAADMLPFPLYGTPKPVKLADSYFQSCTCEFVRNLFDLALDDKLKFLDCLALSNTCDVMRRFYDMWNGYIKDIPVYLINNPQKILTENNQDYYMEELKRFLIKIEEISHNKISDEKLKQAISLYNETRCLLKDLYDLRREDPPLISGEEAFIIATATSILPKDQANPLLRQLLDEIKTRGVDSDQYPEGPRILVTGSIIDHSALIKMIEDQGGIVVADDLCNTTRNFFYQVEDNKKPLTSLYNYHNRRPWCACMHPTEARYDYLLELINEYNVEAVIYFNLKYCHPFLYEAPLLKKQFEAEKIPVTILEVGHDLSGLGQLKTRIQAFLEMVEL